MEDKAMEYINKNEIPLEYHDMIKKAFIAGATLTASLCEDKIRCGDFGSLDDLFKELK